MGQGRGGCRRGLAAATRSAIPKSHLGLLSAMFVGDAHVVATSKIEPNIFFWREQCTKDRDCRGDGDLVSCRLGTDRIGLKMQPKALCCYSSS